MMSLLLQKNKEKGILIRTTVGDLSSLPEEAQRDAGICAWMDTDSREYFVTYTISIYPQIFR